MTVRALELLPGRLPVKLPLRRRRAVGGIVVVHVEAVVVHDYAWWRKLRCQLADLAVRFVQSLARAVPRELACVMRRTW